MKKFFTALCISMLSFVGCVDRSFDLAETSGEMTIGGDELVLPLGEISNITLGDLLKNNDSLENGDNGVYQISFSSFGDDPTKFEKFSIEGVEIPTIKDISPTLDPISFSMESMPQSLQLRPISQSFDVDFPAIGNIMTIEPITMEQELGIDLPEILKKQSQGVIDDRILATLSSFNATTLSAEPKEALNCGFNGEITILKELKKVDWVEFGCDEHPYGTPFSIKIDLQGLKDINGGGEVNLYVEFPDGYYLRDENGNDFPQATHNIFNKTVEIASKQKEISVLVYLHRIDYSKKEVVEGLLSIDDKISCDYKLNLSLCKGSYNLNAKPKLTFEAAPQYKDVEVVINHFELPNLEHSLYYSFNGIPNGVSIKRVVFTDDTKLSVSLKGLEWCKVKDNLTGEDISPKIEIDLPTCMRFGKHALLSERVGEKIAGSGQIAEKNVLLATAAELSNGVTLSLESIECEGSSNIKQEDGSLIIDEKIVVAVHMESIDGHTILVSSLTPPEDFTVAVNISEANLKLNLKETEVTWSEDKSFDLDLGENVPTISQTITIPDMIKSINSIEIGKAGSNDPLSMRFSLNAGNSFPVDELDINLAVNLGKLLRPTKEMLDKQIITQNENGDYIFRINEPWKTKNGAFTKVLQFEALDNIPEIIEGKMALYQSFLVMGSAKIKSGEDIDLSAISDAKVNVDIDIDDIEVRTVTGVVDVAMAPEPVAVDLSELAKLELDFNALSLNPVLSINIKDNPVGVSFGAEVVISTLDKDGNKITTITTPAINVAERGASNIIISTPRNAEKYTKDGVTFIPIEGLSKLLSNPDPDSNGLPVKITVDMKVASNNNEEVTISLEEAEQGYDIEYQYSMLLPFEMDGELDLSYSTEINDLNDVFTSLSDQGAGFKVGDIGLIAEIGTTIPFNIVVSAELIDKNGNSDGVDAKLNLNNCLIEGYDSKRDGKVKVSNIDLDFDLGESHSLKGLRNANGIRLTFTIYNSNAESTSLSKEQFINGQLKLRVRDGLTIDLSNISK